MKKIIGYISGALIVFACICVFGFSTKAYAVSASVGISDPGRPDPGQQFQVNYSISASENCAIQANVSVAGGTVVGGSPSLYDDNCTASTFGGSVIIVSSGEGPVTVTVSGYVVGLSDAGRCDFGQSRQVPIRTYAEIEAAQAAAASQAAIDASIRAEQDSKAASEAEVQASIDASIAESVSIEESISQSEYDSSIEESNSIREESESISLVEKTRAFEMYENYYVPYEIARRIAGNFYFATVDTVVTPPANFKQVELIRNTQKVLAFRNSSMSDHHYLVYGTPDEKTEPGFYFFDSYTDTFFSYEMLTGEEIEQEVVEEETEPETEEEKKETGTVSPIIPIIIGVVAFLLGAVAMYGFLVYFKGNKSGGPKGPVAKKDEDDEEVEEDDEEESEESSDDSEQSNEDIESELALGFDEELQVEEVEDVLKEDAGVPISESTID